MSGRFRCLHFGGSNRVSFRKRKIYCEYRKIFSFTHCYYVASHLRVSLQPINPFVLSFFPLALPPSHVWSDFACCWIPIQIHRGIRGQGLGSHQNGRTMDEWYPGGRLNHRSPFLSPPTSWKSVLLHGPLICNFHSRKKVLLYSTRFHSSVPGINPNRSGCLT